MDSRRWIGTVALVMGASVMTAAPTAVASSAPSAAPAASRAGSPGVGAAAITPAPGNLGDVRTVDAQGALWQIVDGVLERVSTTGVVTRPGIEDALSRVTSTGDGSVWLAAGGPDEDSDRRLVRVDTATQEPEVVADLGAGWSVGVRGPSTEGRVWVTLPQTDGEGLDLALVDPAGEVTRVAVWDHDWRVSIFAGAPDGALWFVSDAYPGPDSASHVTRIGVDGATTTVDLRTGPVGVPIDDEDITSMAFAADGTLYYTTYNVFFLGFGTTGGGIGTYAGGSNTWTARPHYPLHPRTDGTWDAGPQPDHMQRGADGRMYFLEVESYTIGRRLVRLSPGAPVAREQRVGGIGYDEFGIGGGHIWLRHSVGTDTTGGVAAVDRLFAPRSVARTAGLSVRARAKVVRFQGRVRAGVTACRDAAVELRRARPGRDRVIRRGRTGVDGAIAWRVRRAQVPAGRYYLRATRVALDDNLTTCLGDVSPVRRVRAKR